jgi:hypothetical protein
VKGGGFCPSRFAQLDENLDENVVAERFFVYLAFRVGRHQAHMAILCFHACDVCGRMGGRTMRRFWLVHNQSCSMPPEVSVIAAAPQRLLYRDASWAH